MRKFSLLPILFLFLINISGQTILFSEDFEDELSGDVAGASSQGIGWTASCPLCPSVGFFEVGSYGSIPQGMVGNNTDGPTDFIASGIDATGMSIITLEFDYDCNGYLGSGNLECNTECAGCSGDLADATTGSCWNCWDFLSWEITAGTITTGGVVLGNDCNVASADFMLSDPIYLCSATDLSNITVTINMSMWAASEYMVVDNIVIKGYTEAEAIAAGLLFQAGDDNTVNLCSGTGTHDLFDDLLGSPDTGGIWDGPGTTSNGDQGTIDLSSFTPGSYDYIISTAGTCEDTATITVTNTGGSATASVSGVQDICQGETITITGNGTGGTFEWSDGSTNSTLDISAAGNYWFAVIGGCGNDTAFFAIADLGPLPTASVSGIQDICTGESITVTANGSGNYTWSDNSTGSTLSISTPGNYSLTVTNTCGSDTEDFTIGSLGSAPVGSLSGNQFVCNPSASTTLIASGGTSYFWSTSNTSTTETFSAGENGYVLVMNQCGQDSIAFTITNESVIAAFSLSDTIGEEPVTVQTINNSINASSYIWSFGDGSTSTDFSPVIEYPTNGEYIITLIATNTFGCTDTATSTVYVIDPTPLVVPNIFTPNNDDVNDLFKVVHYSVKQFTGSIYNRWGQKLFENSDQYIFQWDGYNESGKPAPDGTYFYILEATFNNGEKQTFSGSFELIR